MKTVSIKKGKEKSILRFHPWVFSGAIHGSTEDLEEGEIVEVIDFKKRLLGLGHFQVGSIAVRIFEFSNSEINSEYWKSKLSAAIDTRRKLGLLSNEETNICRLVHGEGDGLPGLVIDFYNGVAILQCHSIGFWKMRENIAQLLKEILDSELKAVYDKSSETLPRNALLYPENEYLLGESECPLVCKENGRSFNIDWITGQKTGFFIDQRDNRSLLGKYAKDKTVLNTFCYSGGFSIYALDEGAQKVVSVDSSEKAIELVDANVALNPEWKDKHVSIAQDTLEHLKEMQEAYDVIILDPPAYGKHKRVRHNAVQGYKRLNALAMKKIKSGGIIFTFSCSQIVDNQLFYNTISAAAIEVGRQIKVLHQLHQPADHPVNIYHPESNYLKGLVIEVL